MEYSNRPLESSREQRVHSNVVEISERVHWGAILAGLVIAISSQLLLSALGAALGFTTIAVNGAPRTNSPIVAESVGIWSIISIFISLFIGGWITARAYGSVNRNTAALNGAILWATTMAISAWLFAGGVSGTFGVALANSDNIAERAEQNGVNLPDVNKNTSPSGGARNSVPSPTPSLTAQQTRNIAGNGAKATWVFTFGSLSALVASTIGASAGARRSVPIHRLSSHEV